MSGLTPYSSVQEQINKILAQHPDIQGVEFVDCHSVEESISNYLSQQLPFIQIKSERTSLDTQVQDLSGQIQPLTRQESLANTKDKIEKLKTVYKLFSKDYPEHFKKKKEVVRNSVNTWEYNHGIPSEDALDHSSKQSSWLDRRRPEEAEASARDDEAIQKETQAYLKDQEAAISAEALEAAFKAERISSQLRETYSSITTAIETERSKTIREAILMRPVYQEPYFQERAQVIGPMSNVAEDLDQWCKGHPQMSNNHIIAIWKQDLTSEIAEKALKIYQEQYESS